MADVPEWVSDLCDKVLECIEGLTIFEPRYYLPNENGLEGHLIEIAPVKLEIAEASENDGEEIYDPNFDVDLLALKSVFGSVKFFHSGMDFETHSRMFILEATYRRRAVFLNIRTVPFEDAEVVGRLRPGGKFEFFDDLDVGG